MNTISTASDSRASAIPGFIVALVIGLALITVAGHVQGDTPHDSAHDVRHATGFPCH